MPERCPRCREPLLSLNWSMLKQCEPCDGYIEPDGEWVERREGDLRYAELVTRGEPQTVAELAKALRSPPEAFSEDLRSLCRRHRQRHRMAFEKPHEWLTVTAIGRGDPGYRDRSEPPLRRVTVARPDRSGLAVRAGLGSIGLGAALVALGLTMFDIGSPINLVGFMLIVFPVFFGLLRGLGTLLERLIPATGPPWVRTIERREGAALLSVRTSNDESHELPAEHTQVTIEEGWDGARRETTYIARLRAQDFSGRLVRSSDRDVVERFVLRLEYVLGLDSIPE